MNRIFLIGFMASGKSTFGRRLADYLHWDFIDLDDYIERNTKQSIPSLFETQGEKGFRLLEQKCLHEVSVNSSCVIATGGGTPCYSDNLEYMKSQGTTVFLDVSEKELFRRLSKDYLSRPKLKNQPDHSVEALQSGIHHLLAERMSYYSAADIVFTPCKEDINDLLERL